MDWIRKKNYLTPDLTIETEISRIRLQEIFLMGFQTTYWIRFVKIDSELGLQTHFMFFIFFIYLLFDADYKKQNYCISNNKSNDNKVKESQLKNFFKNYIFKM